ncbi:MAG: SDR family NAD(P)-dependent oxidoreductase [Chloroflexota bacterium]
MNNFELTNQVVILTGAAGGLGRAFALAFGEAGARVVCADINEDGIKETARLITEQGNQAIALAVNVTDPTSTEQMVQRVVAQWEQVDVLVNNAAIYAGLVRRPFWEIDPDEWDRVLDVNVKGVWLSSKAVIPSMLERGGRIINIASATFYSGSPGWLHYVASKGSIIGMTRAMARELGNSTITVTHW